MFLKIRVWGGGTEGLKGQKSEGQTEVGSEGTKRAAEPSIRGFFTEGLEF